MLIFPRKLAVIVGTAMWLWTGVVVAGPPPAFSFEAIMDTYFDGSNGLISFQSNLVAFPPEGPFQGSVAVLDSAGKVIKHYKYYDAIKRNGVFGTVQAPAPADVKLTEPGLYTLVYLVEGKPVTRFPVRLRKVDSGGDDPFNPQSKLVFDGYWRTLAHVTGLAEGDPEDGVPELHYWLGGIDMPPNEDRGAILIELLRDGEVVAHSRGLTEGVVIPGGRFDRSHATLYHPHTRKQTPNSRPFTKKDWLADGSYEVRIIRKSDKKKIRSYDFRVADGGVVPLPRTKLDYEPHVDYVLPRVTKKGSTGFEIIETQWIRDGGTKPGGKE